MLARPAVLLSLVVALAAAFPAWAQDAVASARALLAAWHEDPARIDRARTLLEEAAKTADADTLVELANVWFLTGEFRARTEARVDAYERGSEWARQAVAAAPRNDRAHFLLAVNLGRLAELRGVLRAVALVGKVREESETVLRLNPASVSGHILAAGLAAELPGLMGGNRARAETLYKRALELDPHESGGRLELARFYVASRRWRDAQRELQAVLDEAAPTDLPRWTVSDRPRAQSMLADLQERGLVIGVGGAQAP